MDGVELEILWSNLIGIVTERAKALQRIAFSPVVREAGDLACALFDRRGRMVAQANTGTPGHINSLAIAGAHLVRIFANNLKPGDVVTTSDPWMSAGHFFDITVLTPIFDGDRVLAYIGSTIHHTDIGGYGIGAGARDGMKRTLDPAIEALQRRCAMPGAARHDQVERAEPEPCSANLPRRCQADRRKRTADRDVPTLRSRRHEGMSDEIIRARRPQPHGDLKPSRPSTAKARSTCRAGRSARRSRP